MISVFAVQLEDKLELLKKEYDEKLMMKADLQRKAAHMALMMERARRLVEGLAGERLRWLDTVEVRIILVLKFSEQRSY